MASSIPTSPLSSGQMQSSGVFRSFLKLLEKKVDILIVGTGHEGIVDVSRKVRDLALDRKVKIIELQSPYAIEVFNNYASQHKKVVAVIHTTC